MHNKQFHVQPLGGDWRPSQHKTITYNLCRQPLKSERWHGPETQPSSEKPSLIGLTCDLAEFGRISGPIFKGTLRRRLSHMFFCARLKVHIFGIILQ